MANPRFTLRAGELRHRIKIVSPSKIQDEAGQLITADEQIVCETWAKIESLSGKSLYAAQQIVSQCTHKITIRYQRGIVPNLLVWWFDGGSPEQAHQYRIMHAEPPDMKHHFIEMLVIEREASTWEVPGE